MESNRSEFMSLANANGALSAALLQVGVKLRKLVFGKRESMTIPRQAIQQKIPITITGIGTLLTVIE